MNRSKSRTGALAAWFERIWYGGKRVPFYLSIAERIYAFLGLWVRRRLYAAGFLSSERLPIPVVIIGNVTVGGTGKTPLVIYLVQELLRRGWRPGVISRGYGGQSRGVMLVGPSTEPALAGDEAVLIARATHAPVAIAKKRVEAGRLLIERGGCDVLISDDGLQHWALKRDLEIAVIDGIRRLGNERLLPAGPLRDPPRRLAFVDYVVANGRARDGEIAMSVKGRSAQHVLDPGRVVPLTEFKGREVHAVAGIGNPERFFDMLSREGIKVIAHALPDHHAFEGDEIQFGDELPVFVTEKDAVKCARFAHERLFVVPVEAELPPDFADRIHQTLHSLRTQSS